MAIPHRPEDEKNIYADRLLKINMLITAGADSKTAAELICRSEGSLDRAMELFQQNSFTPQARSITIHDLFIKREMLEHAIQGQLHEAENLLKEAKSLGYLAQSMEHGSAEFERLEFLGDAVLHLKVCAQKTPCNPLDHRTPESF